MNTQTWKEEVSIFDENDDDFTEPLVTIHMMKHDEIVLSLDYGFTIEKSEDCEATFIIRKKNGAT